MQAAPIVRTTRNAFETVELSPISPGLLAARVGPSNCRHVSHSSALDLADRLINGPASSPWLYSALVRALMRDDLAAAVSDAEILLSVLSARLEEVQGGAS